MSGAVLPFPPRHRVTAPKRTYREAARLQAAGTVYIWPVDVGGGEWGLFHASRSGDSEAYLGSHFRFDDAVAAGRRIAREIGAAFDEGGGTAA